MVEEEVVEIGRKKLGRWMVQLLEHELLDDWR